MIKYICDTCGQEVFEIEVLGPGVVQNYPDDPHLGKEYKYLDNLTGVEVFVALKKPDHDHFCKACMWKLLERMIDRYGPKTMDVEVDDLSKTTWVGSSVGMFNSMPDIVTPPKEVPNEEPATDPVTDTELSELRFEGVLPETGADERADQEDDGLAPRDRDVPNFDDPAATEYQRITNIERKYRPGWQYRSTANGI